MLLLWLGLVCLQWVFVAYSKWLGRFSYVVAAFPQSEVLEKCLQEIGEKCSDSLAKLFADFRPSISREDGRKTIHAKSPTFSTLHQLFFHRCTSEAPKLKVKAESYGGKSRFGLKCLRWKLCLAFLAFGFPAVGKKYEP